ncbi:hypothetical protein U1Q18_027755 [Sarracenia purpurea var. burkii]
MKTSYIAVFVFFASLLLCYEAEVSMAATCNPTELNPCLDAITSGATPSKLCCSKIKEQTPCLCQYFRNPSLKPYVNSPNAKKLLSTCSVSLPKC